MLYSTGIFGFFLELDGLLGSGGCFERRRIGSIRIPALA